MKHTKTISRQAMITALYAVISLALAPISFGSVQARVSEAFTLLPVFGPINIVGVTLGCFVTNLVGAFTGANILGAIDILFGTAATLVAAVLTYLLRNIRFRGLPVVAALPPIVLNALVVGLELCFVMANGFSWPIFLVQAGLVALGEVISCLLGLVLVRIIQSNPRLTELFGK